MSKRSELLEACFYGNRWSANSAPSSGTTCVASSPTIGTQSRPHLETLLYSIRTGGGGQFTVQVQVRHASIAGTVVAALDHLLGASTTSQVSATALGIPGKRGGLLFVSMNTVIASLVQSISVAGWIEDTNG